MNYAIILASGAGTRSGLDTPKQYLKIKGKTILEYTIKAFNDNELTDRIILVIHPDYMQFAKSLKFEKLYKITEGGKTRQDSSFNGVQQVLEQNAKVLIHDACRPFIKNELINACYSALDEYGAIDTGIETADTIVQVDENNLISKTLKRAALRRCQTPQGFRANLIKKAHKLAKEKNIAVTDDVGLVVSLDLAPVYVVAGDIDNIKITYPDDIEYAKNHIGM